MKEDATVEINMCKIPQFYLDRAEEAKKHVSCDQCFQPYGDDRYKVKTEMRFFVDPLGGFTTHTCWICSKCMKELQKLK